MIRLIILLLTIPFIVNAQDLRIGIYPYDGTERGKESFSIFAKYLSDQTGHEIKSIVTSNYAEISERVRNNSLDIAWVNSTTYINLKKEIPNIRYVATYSYYDEESDTRTPYYSSVIVSLKKSGIKKLNDLKGKKFAFTDINATAGYIIPKMLLEKQNINPEKYFQKIFYMKEHDRLLKAVQAGSVDAGGVSKMNYNSFVKLYGDIFNIIAESNPIPHDPIILTEGAPKGIDDTLRNVFKEIDQHHYLPEKIRRESGIPIGGFMIKDDSFYDELRTNLAKGRP
jgi:phosphonate transport system substrate-binding protein